MREPTTETALTKLIRRVERHVDFECGQNGRYAFMEEVRVIAGDLLPADPPATATDLRSILAPLFALAAHPTPAEGLHTLLWPPHPGGVYESSALCSCGEWQFDSGSPGALFNETRLILSEHTAHRAADSHQRRT